MCHLCPLMFHLNYVIISVLGVWILFVWILSLRFWILPFPWMFLWMFCLCLCLSYAFSLNFVCLKCVIAFLLLNNVIICVFLWILFVWNVSLRFWNLPFPWMFLWMFYLCLCLSYDFFLNFVCLLWMFTISHTFVNCAIAYLSVIWFHFLTYFDYLSVYLSVIWDLSFCLSYEYCLSLDYFL